MHLQRQESNTTTEEETPQRPHKNTYEFNLQKGRKIIISSNFDNGNISLLKQVSELHYRLQAVSDFKTKNNPTRKTWFHFCASVPKGFKVRFTLENVTIYDQLYQEHNWPRPVFRDQRGYWLPITTAFLTYREDVGLVFDHTFMSQSPVYFALTIPHSYNDHQTYLRELTQKIPNFMQYSDQVIAITKQNLNVHMLRITHKHEPQVESKPFVIITCRVHPGQVGSTFCLMGIIDFLMRPCNLQSHLLLKMFQFVIFPMVNPDGVFGGNYRMDLQNTNLNRVYNEPSPDLHPSVFAIKEEIVKLHKMKPQRKIMFHFDLHSHSSLKSAFIYGNAFEDIAIQTQSALFTKLLQHNSQVFKYGSCQFTERHMKMKDKGQNMTKQGCARVVISKLADVTYSYTIQTSIFPYPNREVLAPADHSDFKIDQNSFYDVKNSVNSLSKIFNTKNQMVMDNMLLGYGIMTTILDLFQKNPYTRIVSLNQTVQNYRKQISQSLLQGEERFKMLDTKAYQKVRAIGKIAKQEYRKKYQKQWNYLASNEKLSKIEWPESVKWFEYLAEEKKKKNERRIKTQGMSQPSKKYNDVIYLKGMKKKVFDLEQQICKIEQIEKKEDEKISPSSRNRINLELPTASQYNLPKIRQSIERNAMTNHKRTSNSSCKKKQSEEIGQGKLRSEQKNDISVNHQYPSVEINQIRDLTQRQSTKNIVLSFIHDEMERMSNIKKNQHRNLVVNHKLGNQKPSKKNSSKSLKILLDNNRVYSKPKEGQKSLATQTCEDIINRRKAYIEEQKVSNIVIQTIEEKEKRLSSANNGINVSQGNTHRDHRTNNKKQIAKVKYSEIKKKNIIRQEMGNNIKFPELKKFHPSSKGVQGLFIDSRLATSPNEM